MRGGDVALDRIGSDQLEGFEVEAVRRLASGYRARHRIDVRLLVLTLAACETAPTLDAPSCNDCDLQLETVATLGANGPALRPIGKVTVDGAGNFYVAPTFEPGEIAMYGPDGRFVRSFGRPGEGPGEFSVVFNVLATGHGDSIHVIQTGRHTVIAPELREFVSTRQLRLAPFDVVWPATDTMIVYRMMQTSGTSGDAFHAVDPDGEIIRSHS